jgi:hypothetical protein
LARGVHPEGSCPHEPGMCERLIAGSGPSGDGPSGWRHDVCAISRELGMAHLDVSNVRWELLTDETEIEARTECCWRAVFIRRARVLTSRVCANV